MQIKLEYANALIDGGMDNQSGAKRSTGRSREEELCLETLVFMVAAAVIALATVVLLPVVAQVIAFVTIVKWFKTKLFS